MKRCLALLPALALACEDTPIVHRGEHVELRASASIEVCAGTGRYLDGFVPFLVGELGLDPDHGSTIEVVWLADEGLSSRCEEARGCFARGRVWTREAAPLHGLVHAIADAHLGRSAPFFEEGLASAYDP